MNTIVLAVIVISMNGTVYLSRFLQPFNTEAECETKLAVVQQQGEGVLLRQFANEGVAIKEMYLSCMTVEQYQASLLKK